MTDGEEGVTFLSPVLRLLPEHRGFRSTLPQRLDGGLTLKMGICVGSWIGRGRSMKTVASREVACRGVYM